MSVTSVTSVSQGEGGIGNMVNTPVKKDFKCRKWVFTWNNYSDSDYVSLLQWFREKKYRFVMGKEVAPTTGTKHIQGFFEYKNMIRRSTIVKKWPKMRVVTAKGTAEQNFEYCYKDGDWDTNIKCKLSRHARLLMKYKNVVWKPWQKKVIEILEGKSDDRTINWFWEMNGCVGKSFLAKYIVLKYGAIIADGKKDNVFNQINMALDNDKDIRVVLLDVPRYNMDYVNYGCLEQIKNGMLYSGKYEGGVCLFDHPHLIVFANEPPDIEKMSKDRWNIVEI